MRFHHSTRRGKRGQSNARASHSKAYGLSASKLQQLAYCKETNIHFNRPEQVLLPECLRRVKRRPSAATDALPSSLTSAQMSPSSSPLLPYDICGVERSQVFATAASPLVVSRTQLLTNSELRDVSASVSTTATAATTEATTMPPILPQNSNSNNNNNNNASISNSELTQIENSIHLLSVHSNNANDCKTPTIITSSPTLIKLSSLDSAVKGKDSFEQKSNININNNEHAFNETTMTNDKLSSFSQKDNFKQVADGRLLELPAHCARQLSVEEARAKLVAQVDKHPFWSKKAAKRMQLKCNESRRVLLYELASFCEMRELEWRFEPYKGGLVQSVPFRRSTVDFNSNAAATKAKLLAINASDNATTTIIPTTTSFVRNNNNNNGNDNKQQQQVSICATLSQSPFASPTSSNNKNSNDKQQHNSLDWHYDSSVSRRVSMSCNLVNSNSSSLQQARQSPLNEQFRLLSKSPDDIEALATIHKREQPSPDLLWSLQPLAQPNTSFSPCVSYCEVPNTSFVKRCHCCSGRGRLKCDSCHGVGYEVCVSCSGKGSTRSYSSTQESSANKHDSRRSYYNSLDNDDDNDNNSPFGGSASKSRRSADYDSGSSMRIEICHNCHGSGQKRCWICAGRAYTTCQACLGAGQLRCFMRLIVTWQIHKDETVLNNSDNIIPIDRLKLSTGKLLLEESDVNELSPLFCRDQNINSSNSFNQPALMPIPSDETIALHTSSRKLLDKQRKLFSQQRLIAQRQKVIEFNCELVNYEWKQRRGQFVIYGDEQKVYISKYPFRTICNIT